MRCLNQSTEKNDFVSISCRDQQNNWTSAAAYMYDLLNAKKREERQKKSRSCTY